jgi:hypothetical protein
MQGYNFDVNFYNNSHPIKGTEYQVKAQHKKAYADLFAKPLEIYAELKKGKETIG